MKPSLTRFEKIAASLSPRWTLGRVRARMALETAVRHYEAAQPGRRTQNWRRAGGDADLLVRAALIQLRTHARDLLRNNSWAQSGQDTIANNTVGKGIKPKALSPVDGVAQKAAALWKTWAETTECDSEGRKTFYGIQAQALRAIVSDGEVLIRRRYRKSTDALTLPLQLQVLEADYLDSARNTIGSDAGGPIIAGVEFDKLGDRAAYWLFKEHPGSGRNSEASRRIPADQVAHIYIEARPGQSRGISWLAAAILNLKDFDEFEDAELMRQKIAACFAAFVSDMDGDAVGSLGSTFGQTQTQPQVESLEPGMIQYLPVGKQVTFGTPPVTTGDGYTNRILRRVAKGLKVTYEDLTGDYSQVNFSSARMARIAHWKSVEAWQDHMLIPQLCNPVWAWAMSAATVSGELPASVPAPSAVWTVSPMPLIEPDKEALAITRMVRAGLKSLSDAMREQGLDPDTQFAELAADNARIDMLKLTLDSDARKTTAAGQEQMSQTPQAAPANSPVKMGIQDAIDALVPSK